MAFTVTVRYNHIPRVQASITEKSVAAVRDNAHRTQEYAATIAPVRTGAFRASIYVNGPENESDYGQHAAAAIRLNPRATIVPEQQAATLDVGVNRMRNSLGQFSLPEALVSSAVEYAAYLEDGTVHMAPRPTFRPAAMVVERQFLADMQKVADGF